MKASACTPRATGRTASAAGGACPPPAEAGEPRPADLAYEEYCRRLEAGERPDADAFCGQFPSAVQRSLRGLLLAHELLVGQVPGRDAGAAWPEPGDVFLGFRLRRLLGRGAFARVFLAAEAALGDRPVVVKVSRLGTAEAATLGRLSHRNVVPVNSVQVDPATGLTAICMPYLGSATLDDVLGRAFHGPGPPARARIILEAARPAVPADVPPADREVPARVLERGTYVEGVLHLGAELADALAFIHGLGVCHQDLKPSNVLLSPDGRPMLLDFNLSRDERAGRGLVGGTLPYMSPEQLRAFAADQDQPPPDARSDLFALGVILYELLTGQLPFGPTPLGLSEKELCREQLERRRRGPRPLRAAGAQADRAVLRLIERCLAYEPRLRPGSAAELAAAFRRALSAPRRARRWLAGHARAVAAALVLGLALGTTGLLAVSSLPHPEENAAGLEQGEPASPSEAAAVRSFQQGEAAFRRGHYQRAVEHLSRALEMDPERPEVWFARGRARQQLGGEKDLGLALADYEQAGRRYPAGKAQAGKAKACIAYCLNRLGKHGQARFLYEEALAAGFAPAEVCNDLGYSYLQQARFAEAGLALDRALDLDPGLRAAYHNRALLAHRRAFLLIQEGAAEKLLPPERLPPPQERARARLARCLQQGIDDVRKAIAAGPGNAELYCNAARLCTLAAQEYPQQARAWITEGQGYLAKAVKLGEDRTRLAWDSSLTLLFDTAGAKDLRQGPRPRPAAAVLTSRLVDPLAPSALP
jgi:serine/threonine protein kinase/Flp pilus assembly protein TadD